MDKLTETLIETGITLGFDAIGGGQMASDILTAMERAASRNATGLNSYGSSQLKQVYLYGSLDFSPTTLNRAYGMAWSVGGWLMPLLLARIGRERTEELRQRIADEINTIFASDYTAELWHRHLQEMITPEAIARYLPKKTGEKISGHSAKRSLTAARHGEHHKFRIVNAALSFRCQIGKLFF